MGRATKMVLLLCIANTIALACIYFLSPYLIPIYGYQYLYGQEEKAIPYAQRWAELDPEDENAPAVIRECKAEIRKRQRSRKKKAKFVPGDTPFEGFDLTNFWDDNW